MILRKRFLRLCVAILCLFLFFHTAYAKPFKIKNNYHSGLSRQAAAFLQKALLFRFTATLIGFRQQADRIELPGASSEHAPGVPRFEYCRFEEPALKYSKRERYPGPLV